MSISATGATIVLEADGTRAVIGTVAAVLREVTVGGVAITEAHDGSVPPPGGNGIILTPWPGRVRDGRWTLDGVPQQLDLTDPGKGNAIHGLLRNTAYEVRAQTASSVTLGALLPPQHGWPFLLDTWVRYEVRPDGLMVTHGATNLGDRRAPYATGAHPYLRVGATPVEDLTLTVAAATWFESDDRSNPVAEHPVDGTAYDARLGVRVGDIDYDTTFGGVTHLEGASAWLTAPDGARVEVVQDVDWGFVQVFTPRNYPMPGGDRLAIAVEPMTAPPDALNSGRGLQWLEPGDVTEGSWGLRYTAGTS